MLSSRRMFADVDASSIKSQDKFGLYRLGHSRFLRASQNQSVAIELTNPTEL